MATFSFNKWMRRGVEYADTLFSKHAANQIMQQLACCRKEEICEELLKLRYGVIKQCPIGGFRSVRFKVNLIILRAKLKKVYGNTAVREYLGEIREFCHLKTKLYRKCRNLIPLFRSQETVSLVKKVVEEDCKIRRNNFLAEGSGAFDAVQFALAPIDIFPSTNSWKRKIYAPKSISSEEIKSVIEAFRIYDLIKHFQCAFINGIDRIGEAAAPQRTCYRGPLFDWYIDERNEQISDQQSVQYYMNLTEKHYANGLISSDMRYRMVKNLLFEGLDRYCFCLEHESDLGGYTFEELVLSNAIMICESFDIMRNGEYGVVSRTLKEWIRVLSLRGVSELSAEIILNHFSLGLGLSPQHTDPRDVLLFLSSKSKELVLLPLLMGILVDPIARISAQVRYSAINIGDRGKEYESRIRGKWEKIEGIEVFPRDFVKRKIGIQCDLLAIFDETLIVGELKSKLQPFTAQDKLKAVLELQKTHIQQVLRISEYFQSESGLAEVRKIFKKKSGWRPRGCRNLLLCGWNMGKSIALKDITILSEVYVRNFFTRSPMIKYSISGNSPPLSFYPEELKYLENQNRALTIADFDEYTKSLPPLCRINEQGGPMEICKNS